MAFEGDRLQFEPPEGWSFEREGNRYVFTGPRNEALMISSRVVSGIGTPEGEQEAEEKLFMNAFEAAVRGTIQPQLIVDRGLREVPHAHGRAWTIEARIPEEQGLLLEAVLRFPGAVMLVTLEGPAGDELREVFRSFLAGVRPRSPPPATV